MERPYDHESAIRRAYASAYDIVEWMLGVFTAATLEFIAWAVPWWT